MKRQYDTGLRRNLDTPPPSDCVKKPFTALPSANRAILKVNWFAKTNPIMEGFLECPAPLRAVPKISRERSGVGHPLKQGFVSFERSIRFCRPPPSVPHLRESALFFCGYQREIGSGPQHLPRPGVAPFIRPFPSTRVRNRTSIPLFSTLKC